jgi:hypothetical protein
VAIYKSDNATSWASWLFRQQFPAVGGIVDPSFGEDEFFIDCLILGNQAHLGGGLYMANQVASCTGCLFVDNRSS